MVGHTRDGYGAILMPKMKYHARSKRTGANEWERRICSPRGSRKIGKGAKIVITRPEFDVLCALYKRADLKADELAKAMGMTSEEASEVYGRLVEKQLVDDNGVTEQGLEELAPYKVDNAIIMAAGTSSRFAPVSYEKPKGLLKVRGQILIERQIEQLLEAGVDDITVVVGYKAELFFYLEEKYGVKLVVNPEFARRNNINRYG